MPANKKKHVQIDNPDKFFAILSNDHDIAGSGLEGYNTEAFCDFILILQQTLETKNPAVYKAMSPIMPEIKEITQDKDNIATNYAKNGHVTFKSGWHGTNDYAGHAIIAQMQKAPDGSLLVTIYNGGAGLEYHTQKYSAKGPLYATSLRYSIPSQNNTDAARAAIIKTLTDPLTEPVVPLETGLSDTKGYYLKFFNTMLQLDAVEVTQQKILHATPSTIGTAINLITQVFYPIKNYVASFEIVKNIISKVSGRTPYVKDQLGDELQAEDSSKSVFSLGQRGGTCSWKSLAAFIKNKLQSDHTYMLFKFELKLLALQQYFDYLNSSNKINEPFFQEQILSASGNLSRLIEKLELIEPPILSPERKQEGLAIIKNVRVSSTIQKQNRDIELTEVKFPADQLKSSTIDVNNRTFHPFEPTVRAPMERKNEMNIPLFDQNNIAASFLRLKKYLQSDIDKQQKLMVFNIFLNSIDLPLPASFDELIIDESAKIAQQIVEICKVLENYSTEEQRTTIETIVASATLNAISIVIAKPFLDARNFANSRKNPLAILTTLFESLGKLQEKKLLIFDPRFVKKLQIIANIHKLATDELAKLRNNLESNNLSRYSYEDTDSSKIKVIDCFKDPKAIMNVETATKFFEALSGAEKVTKKLGAVDNIHAFDAYMRMRNINDASANAIGINIDTANMKQVESFSDHPIGRYYDISITTNEFSFRSWTQDKYLPEFSVRDRVSSYELNTLYIKALHSNPAIAFLRDLASIYAAKNSKILFIFELIQRYHEKLAFPVVQDVILVNLFKDDLLQHQLLIYPPGVGNLIELLHKKFMLYYDPAALNSTSIFLLQITLLLSNYIMHMPDTIKENPIILEIIVKLETINANVDALVKNVPQNIELRCIQTIRLANKFMSDAQLTESNVEEILSCAIILNSKNYMINNQAVEPWIAKAKISQLLLTRDRDIAALFDDESKKRSILRNILADFADIKLGQTSPIVGNYPYFTCQDVEDHECIINLRTCEVLIARTKLQEVPVSIVTSHTYKHHFGQQVHLGILLNTNYFKFTDKEQDINYVCKVNERESLYRFFAWPNNNSLFNYISKPTELSEKIPSTMFDKNHDVWTDGQNIIITQHVDKLPLYQISDSGIVDIRNKRTLLSYSALQDNSFIKTLNNFEGQEFIEIWQDLENTKEFHIKLPRYNIALFTTDGGITFFWQADTRYKLSRMQGAIIPDFKNCLILEPIEPSLNLNSKMLIPRQEITYDPDTAEIGLDINDALSIRNVVFKENKNRLFRNEVEARAKIHDAKLTTNKKEYINTQYYSEFALDATQRKPIPHSCAEALHLAYIYLNLEQHSEAQILLKHAFVGYNGTAEELYWLQKILSKQPTYVPLTPSEQRLYDQTERNTPQIAAVKMCALNLHAKHPQKIELLSNDDAASLQCSINRVLRHYYNKVNNIPSIMCLSTGEELNILQHFSNATTLGRLSDLEQHAIGNITHTTQQISTYLTNQSELPKPKVKDLLDSISNLLGFLQDIHLSIDSEDYSYIAKNALQIIDLIILNRDTTKKSDVLRRINRLTKVFFDPRGNIYEFFNELPYTQAETIRQLLALLNYVAKYHNNIDPKIMHILDGKFVIPAKKARAFDYIDPHNPLKKFFNELDAQISRINNFETISIDYSHPILPTIPFAFPKLEQFTYDALNTPEASGTDPISSDMDAIFSQAKLSIESPAVASTSAKHVANVYEQLMRDEFINDCDVARRQLAANTQDKQEFYKILNVEMLNSISTKVNKIAKEVTYVLDGQEEAIIKAANFIIAQKSEQAELLLASGRRHEITFTEILRLFLSGNKDEYIRQTFLDDERIMQLQQQVHNYLIQATRLQHLQRIQKCIEKLYNVQNIEQQKALKDELIKLFTSRRTYDPIDNKAMLLFEFLDNKILRPEQSKYIGALLNESAGQFDNVLAHIIMGGGKSKVLLPLLTQMKANHGNLPIVIVSRDMYQTNLADLSATSQHIFGQQYYELKFSRETTRSSNYFKNLYFTLMQIKSQGDYILTTPESMQSLELQYLELLKNLQNISLEELDYLKNILLLIKNHGDAIVDEIDQNLNARKELNYAIGEKTSIAILYPNLIEDAIGFYKNLANYISLQNIILGKITPLDETQQNLLARKIALALLNDKNSILHKILGIELGTQNISAEQKGFLIEYLCSKKEAPPEFIRNFSVTTLERIAYIRENLSGMLNHTLLMNRNEDYGLRPTPGDPIKSNIAVPYVASNTPSLRSEYSSVFKQINCTLQAHYGLPLTFDIFQYVVEDFRGRYLDALDISVLEAETILAEFATLTNSGNIKLQNLMPDSEQIKKLYANAKDISELKTYALSNYILPGIELNTMQLRSNPQRLMRMFRTVQGFTGTPYNYRTLMPYLRYKSELSLGAEGQIVVNIITNTQAVHNLNQNNALEQILNLLHNNDKMHALIDQGALCKDYSNLEIAKQLRKNLEASKIKYILFFDDKTNQLSALPIDPNLPVQILDSSDPEVIYSLINVTPQQCFTYYDQRHCTGIDIRQTNDACAFVTMGTKVIKRDLLQAAMRMRNLSENQKLEFIIPFELTSTISNPQSIIDYCLKQEIEELADEHLFAAKQKISALLIDDLRAGILTADNSNASKIILDASEKLFFTQFAVSLYQQFGQRVDELPTKEVLQKFAQEQVTLWRNAKKEANIIDTDVQAAERIISNINSIIEEALLVCKKTAFTNESLLENEQEQQLELNVEAEQELEIELELATSAGYHDGVYAHGPHYDELDSIFAFNKNSKSWQIKLISANKAFETVMINCDWMFTNNVFLSDNLLNVSSSQNDYLQFKREINEVLIIHDPNTGEAAYVAIAPEETITIINYCEKRNLNVNVTIQSLHGYVHYDKRAIHAAHIESKSADFAVAMEQLAYYNGDLDLVARNPQWMKTDFASKKAIIAKLMRIHHPEKLKYLTMLSESPILFSNQTNQHKQRPQHKMRQSTSSKPPFF